MSPAPRRPGVTLFRDFVEDQRLSMEIYANELAAALARLPDAPAVGEFVPDVAGHAGDAAPSMNAMRWARYVRYPRQAASAQGQINHVVDHGYAHLLWTLDPARTVVTVHDLIPLLRWKCLIEGAPREGYPFLNKLSLSALRRARWIVSVSQRTADDLVTHVGIDPARIRVAPHGLAPRFRPAPAADKPSLRARLGLPEATQLVLITGDSFYKNHRTCLHVLRAMLDARSSAAPRLAFVRIGSVSQDWLRQVREVGVADHLIELGRLPDEDIPALYNSVDCLLFPSLYEGFGWPVLEAMGCGLPVVCSDAGSLPEVAADAALVRAPHDAIGLAQAVGTCLTDLAAREQLVARGLSRAARYPWHRHADVVLETYDAVFSSHRGAPIPMSAH